MNHLKRCLAGGPVTCDICGKEAVNELALASHKRFNHEERPSFACSYCGKQFKRILRLKEHEANHRGEVLYSCPYCPRTCNSSSNMYTHKKVAHPELWAAKVADRFYKRQIVVQVQETIKSLGKKEIRFGLAETVRNINLVWDNGSSVHQHSFLDDHFKR